MSVSRLSEIDPNPATEPMDVPGKTNEATLDRVVGEALAHIPDDDQPPPPKKDLDTLISEGLDKREAAIADQEAFAKSKSAREELDARYAQYDGNTAKTLDLFLDMMDKLDVAPQETAQQIAANYLRASRYALDTTPEAKAKPEAYVDPQTGNRYSSKILDHILDGATDSKERETFEATKEQRARLKARWPSLTFDQAMGRIRAADRRLHEFPMEGAAELGAMAGMPVMPADVERHNYAVNLGNQIDQALPTMPGLDQQKVLDILAMPEFKRSGDHMQDLRRAYAVTQQLAQQEQRVGSWVESELKNMDPSLAAAVQDVILHDKRFAEMVKRNTATRFGDESVMRENFTMAVGWAQSDQRAVAKAKRAAPVRSSSGALATQLGKGTSLDNAISAALKDY